MWKKRNPPKTCSWFLIKLIWSSLDIIFNWSGTYEMTSSRWLLTRGSCLWKASQPIAHYTTTYHTYANTLLHQITSFSSELSRCLFTSEVYIYRTSVRAARAAIGWYEKLIIQLIFPLWRFNLVLCNESPTLLKWHSTVIAMSSTDSRLLSCGVLRNNVLTVTSRRYNARQA